MAHPPAPGADHRRTTDPTRPLPRLLQHHPAPPRTTPAHPTTGLPRATTRNTHRHPTTQRGLPHSPRPHRHQRQAHPAPQQPTTPPRNGSQTRRHQRPHPDPRPTHPGLDHGRAPTTRTPTGSHQGLPTTAKNVNDVLRHLCTMSRDITAVEPRGFEPLTSALQRQRSTN